MPAHFNVRDTSESINERSASNRSSTGRLARTTYGKMHCHLGMVIDLLRISGIFKTKAADRGDSDFSTKTADQYDESACIQTQVDFSDFSGRRIRFEPSHRRFPESGRRSSPVSRSALGTRLRHAVADRRRLHRSSLFLCGRWSLR